VANRDRVGWLSYTVRRGLESVVEVRSGASAWPGAMDDAGSQAASSGRVEGWRQRSSSGGVNKQQQSTAPFGLEDGA
jgi:hypothetical protein